MSNSGHLALGGVQNSYSFPFAAAGRIGSSTSAKQLPDIPCEQVFFKAPSTNTGIVYIGGSNVSSTEGISLLAGEFSPWIPVQNLNEIWYIASATTAYLQYFIVR